MTEQKDRSFAVIGLGSFGSSVARELARFGNYVLGIDILERNVSQLADELSEAVIADGRDEDALREAGLGSYDVVLVAIGEDLEASVLCTMNVKMLGVETVWVKALSRTHHRILAKLGVDRVVQVEQEIGLHVAQRLHNPAIRDYMALGNGYYVVNIEIPERLAGRTLASLGIADAFEVRCLGIMRGTDHLNSAKTGLKLEEGDRMLVLGQRQELRRFGDSL